MNKPKPVEWGRGLALALVIGLGISSISESSPAPAKPSPNYQHCTTEDPDHPGKNLTASCQVGSIPNSPNGN